MTRPIGIAALTLVLWIGLSVRADAQVVQLPSIRTFSYSGSVLVPDSGGAYLGGVSRSASSSSRRGPSRGFGGAAGVGQAGVGVTIIDHAEIDRQLLGGTPSEFMRRGRTDQSIAGKAADPTEEGKALVRHARTMYRSGNPAAAKASYQMAIELLDGRLQQLATAEYRRLFVYNERR